MFFLFPFLLSAATAYTADCYAIGQLSNGGACVQWCPQGSFAGQYECYTCTAPPGISYTDATFTITAPQYLQSYVSGTPLLLGTFAIAKPASVTVTAKANFATWSMTTYTGLTFDNGVTNPNTVPTSVLKFTGSNTAVGAAMTTLTYNPISYLDAGGGSSSIANSVDTLLFSFTDGTNYAQIEMRVMLGTADPSWCECKRKTNGMVCSGHGTCDWQTSPTACTCFNINFTGNNCDKRSCNVCMTGGTTACNAGTVPFCQCKNSVASGAPYTGDRCQYQTCPSDCNTNGTCDRNTGICTCFEGYYGHDCSQLRCINNCSGNGRCVGGTCTCYVGFDGPDCSKIFCPRDCGASGGCDFTTGKCTRCSTGFSDPDCMFVNCPSAGGNICNLTGDCDYKTGLCTCYVGYSGVDCSYH